MSGVHDRKKPRTCRQPHTYSPRSPGVEEVANTAAFLPAAAISQVVVLGQELWALLAPCLHTQEGQHGGREQNGDALEIRTPLPNPPAPTTLEGSSPATKSMECTKSNMLKRRH